jgi:WD40 repeat protein
MLHRSLGLAPTVLDQPEVVVAEGSVLWTQAGQRTTTFPIQRTPQQAGLPPAPLTPVVTHLAPPSPQTAPAYPAPPQTAPTYQQYSPSTQDERPAPTAPQQEPSPARHNLPPQTVSPQATPPLSVDGDDALEPPRTEAERQRAKKVGRRGIIAFILVDILIIAGLVWYFSPRDDGFYDGGGDGSGYSAPSFDPAWETGAIGDLVGELQGAHEGPIASLASIEVNGEPRLFSAGSDGAVRQWSMASGEIIAGYMIDGGVSSLWSATASDGDPIVVAVDGDYMPHVWSAGEGEFVSADPFELGIDMDDARVRIGTVLGEPVLTFVNNLEFQVYYLEGGYSDGPVRLPDGLDWPNFFASVESGYTEIVAVGADHELAITDGITGDPLTTIADEGDWAADQAASGLGIVYDEGTPYAMLYTDADTDDQMLHFWDLDEYGSAYAALPYDDLGNRYHDEIVWAGGESALMYTDQSGVAQVIGLDSGETWALGDADSGAVTETGDLTLDDGREFAVTGDDQGNIRFWSLGN